LCQPLSLESDEALDRRQRHDRQRDALVDVARLMLVADDVSEASRVRTPLRIDSLSSPFRPRYRSALRRHALDVAPEQGFAPPLVSSLAIGKRFALFFASFACRRQCV
jgi:hypothetical protein